VEEGGGEYDEKETDGEDLCDIISIIGKMPGGSSIRRREQ